MTLWLTALVAYFIGVWVEILHVEADGGFVLVHVLVGMALIVTILYLAAKGLGVL